MVTKVNQPPVAPEGVPHIGQTDSLTTGVLPSSLDHVQDLLVQRRGVRGFVFFHLVGILTVAEDWIL